MLLIASSFHPNFHHSQRVRAVADTLQCVEHVLELFLLSLLSTKSSASF